MIQESDIHDKLAALQRGEVSVFDVGDWIDANSWNMHRDSSSEAIKLASSIDRLFAEYDHGYLSEEVLEREVVALMPPQNLLRVHIIIESGKVSRFVAPVPASSSRVEQVQQIWVPESIAAGY